MKFGLIAFESHNLVFKFKITLFSLFIHCITFQNCLSLTITRHLRPHGIAFLGIGMKTDLFQFCGHCWVLQICWHIECSTFTASSFRIWNSSTRILSPSLALFVVMLPEVLLTSFISQVLNFIKCCFSRGWDGWMASLARWTWVWVNSGSWWWTGRPGVLQFMGLQRVGHD